MKIAIALGFGVCLVLGGCSLFPKPAPPPARHDFGVPPMRAPVTVEFTVLTNVTAPPWLDDTEIHYRLDYVDATQVRAYADNRWVAPPAVLLESRLLASFGDTDTRVPGPAYRLSVRLLDFEQEFSAPQAAGTRLRVLAELRDAGNGATVARHVFSVSQSGAPDAQGAVQGAAGAMQTLVGDLQRWVQAHVASANARSAAA
ncbi:MAG: ABC-type transport auxiliary lipoprotein family protein [Gammaproteobacteria bacterium]